MKLKKIVEEISFQLDVKKRLQLIAKDLDNIVDEVKLMRPLITSNLRNSISEIDMAISKLENLKK